MNCNVVKDLLPLYVDGCCSHESAALVEEHLGECGACKAELSQMKTPMEEQGGLQNSTQEQPHVPTQMSRVNGWKASVLQMVLLFLPFGMITLGVAVEATTGSSHMFNGWWAFNLVIPATGFLLSLATWYFLPLYQSRKQFSNVAWLTTLGITTAAFVWGLFHYEMNWFEVFGEMKFIGEIFESIPLLLLMYGLGGVLTAVLCVLSKVLSNRYAKLLGKE